MRQVLAEFLRAIPQSNQEAASIAKLVQGDTMEATLFVTGVAYFLKMWGIVWFDEEHMRQGIAGLTQNSNTNIKHFATCD